MIFVLYGKNTEKHFFTTAEDVQKWINEEHGNDDCRCRLIDNYITMWSASNSYEPNAVAALTEEEILDLLNEYSKEDNIKRSQQFKQLLNS